MLVERHGARVLSVIEKQVGDHHAAHDLAQEVWLRVFRGLHGFRAGASVRPWLFAIAFNVVRDEHRRRARRESHLHDSAPAHTLDGAAAARHDDSRRAEELDAIDRALAGVPEPYRAALQLVDALGFSYDEAAVSLDCSAGTVKSRVHRGRLAFRDRYERLSGETSRHRTPISPATEPHSSASHTSSESTEEFAQ